MQLGAAARVVHRQQALARGNDLLEPLVSHGHSHRELALVDSQLATKGEEFVAQSLRARVPAALRQRAPLEHGEHVESQRVEAEPGRVRAEACAWQHARSSSSFITRWTCSMVPAFSRCQRTSWAASRSWRLVTTAW